MKHIVLLTTKYSNDKADAWLTNEMAYSLVDKGFNVAVVVFSWLKNDPPSSVCNLDGVKVIRIKLHPFFYSSGSIGTALKVFLFPLWARHLISKNIDRCDLLIGNTPCLTTLGLPAYMRSKFGSRSYLVLWDFFPFYLKDLGAIKNNLSFRFFHYIEERMYQSFDRIGCMTGGNLNFLRMNYRSVKAERVEILPLWASIKDSPLPATSEVRTRYGLPVDGFVAVYGGAMSIVQELENILDLAFCSMDLNVFFVFIGRGTERDKLEEVARKRNLSNVLFLDYVPRDEYEDLIKACDVGIISLSRRLSVPSFPSKSIDYFKVGIPVLASLDSATDFGRILEEEIRAGLYAAAGEVSLLKEKLRFLVENSRARAEMGLSGRRYYEEQLSVEKARDKILRLIEEDS